MAAANPARFRSAPSARLQPIPRTTTALRVAGCYAQMNGYKTRIFEMHDKPGGLCTSWKREGYTFDGCIEWLLGSKAGTAMNRMWRELGAVQGRTFIDYEVFQRIEGSDGQALYIHADLD